MLRIALIAFPLSVCATFSSALAAGNGEAAPVAMSVPSAAALDQWGQPPLVFVGLLQNVETGPVGLSEPPLYTHRLSFRVSDSLRGWLKPGEVVMLNHSVRQARRPVFPDGKECLVSAQQVSGQTVAIAVVESTPQRLVEARGAVAVPIGWKVEDGKLVSPWAALGRRAWPDGAALKADLACARTGRPALRVPAGITLDATPVPPAKAIQWTNPDGDGEYTITVANTTDKPVRVPALLCDGPTILWKESLLIVCQGRAYTIPGCRGLAGRKVEAVELAPGKSVSTVVNALVLQGPEWPRGGYRIEFQFCLGDRGVVQSFYYLWRHHDAVRASLADRQQAPATSPAGEGDGHGGG